VAFGLPENQAQQENSKLSESTLDSVTNIIQNFENPKLPGEKTHVSGEKLQPASQKAVELLIDRLKQTGLAKGYSKSPGRIP
jgi:hypothetical protein